MKESFMAKNWCFISWYTYSKLVKCFLKVYANDELAKEMNKEMEVSHDEVVRD